MIIAPGLPSYLISIHAPREGGDPASILFHVTIGRFQSTPPARGATTPSIKIFGKQAFQSTPPARGATHHQSTEYP